VGKHGTRKECVKKFILLCAGYVCLADNNIQEQDAFQKQLKDLFDDLQGKNLGCWCSKDGPCHADVLLYIANKEKPVHLTGEKIKELLHES